MPGEEYNRKTHGIPMDETFSILERLCAVIGRKSALRTGNRIRRIPDSQSSEFQGLTSDQDIAPEVEEILYGLESPRFEDEDVSG